MSDGIVFLGHIAADLKPGTDARSEGLEVDRRCLHVAVDRGDAASAAGRVASGTGCLLAAVEGPATGSSPR